MLMQMVGKQSREGSSLGCIYSCSWAYSWGSPCRHQPCKEHFVRPGSRIRKGVSPRSPPQRSERSWFLGCAHEEITNMVHGRVGACWQWSLAFKTTRIPCPSHFQFCPSLFWNQNTYKWKKKKGGWRGTTMRIKVIAARWTPHKATPLASLLKIENTSLFFPIYYYRKVHFWVLRSSVSKEVALGRAAVPVLNFGVALLQVTEEKSQ